MGKEISLGKCLGAKTAVTLRHMGKVQCGFPVHSGAAALMSRRMLDTNSFSLNPIAETAHLRVPLFSITGAHAGPRLVATGPEDAIRDVAERLWTLPDLVGMCGSLVVRANDQDPVFDRPDFVLSLEAADEAYDRLLGRMTALGMIAGHGVPESRVA